MQEATLKNNILQSQQMTVANQLLMQAANGFQ
jgi:hypothetical protein